MFISFVKLSLHFKCFKYCYICKLLHPPILYTKLCTRIRELQQVGLQSVDLKIDDNNERLKSLISSYFVIKVLLTINRLTLFLLFMDILKILNIENNTMKEHRVK